MSKTQVAVKETTAVATAAPSYIKNTGRGNEDVEAQHLTIPRIKLLQKMSDEVDRHHANYVAGAKDGDFMNSLTKEIYGDSLYVIPLKFRDQFVVWRNREAGGGLLGSFPTNQAAIDKINEQEKPVDYTISQTHEHIIVLKDSKTGELSKPAIMDFSSSKLRVSRGWNSQINIKGGDRFAGLWKMTAVAVKNKAGAAFMNLDVEFAGWAQEEDYLACEKLFEQFAK